MTPYVVCLVTVESRTQGRRIAQALVREKLAACVNLVPGIESIYRWKGKVERSRELLLVIKTARSKMRALTSRVKKLHSYTVPEVACVPIVGGNRDYLKWIKDSVGRRRG